MDDSSRWGVKQHHVTLSDTAISRALSAHQTRKCHHEWYLLRFGSGGRGLLGAGEDADGGTQFLTLRILVRDDTFARELGKMPNAQEVWHTVLQAGENAPEKTDTLFGDWYWTPDHSALASWWARNAQRMRDLARPSVSRGNIPQRPRP